MNASNEDRLRQLTEEVDQCESARKAAAEKAKREATDPAKVPFDQCGSKDGERAASSRTSCAMPRANRCYGLCPGRASTD